MGVSPTGDMEMVQQIKDEVRRLCTRYNIAAKIAENELEENLDVQREKYFSESPRSPDVKVGTKCEDYLSYVRDVFSSFL